MFSGDSYTRLAVIHHINISSTMREYNDGRCLSKRRDLHQAVGSCIVCRFNGWHNISHACVARSGCKLDRRAGDGTVSIMEIHPLVTGPSQFLAIRLLRNVVLLGFI